VPLRFLRTRCPKKCGDTDLSSIKILRYIIAFAVASAVGYFFYLEFKKNADAISASHFTISPFYLFIAMIIGTMVFLIGPLVWRMYVNHYVNKKLNFYESVALYNTSAMCKYIPGKIWTYAAQIALMSSKGISAAILIYINMVCFICLAFVAVMFALYYYLFSLKILAWEISVLIFVLLIALDVVFIVWNTKIINYLIILLNRIFKMEIEPVKIKRVIFVYTQMYYFLACLLLGVAMYFLAKGMGMEIPLSSIFAIMATISVAGILGYLAFFTMGGLGVREGAMFFMLKQFTGVETALILPVAARLLTIFVELLMGAAGIFIGMKYGYFPKLGKSESREMIAEEAEADAQ
jgi:uncharacterized membrane protein YbhN (UPF0104 family)